MQRVTDLLATIRGDLAASLAVVFVGVPLCLGIAHASGAPLVSGLVTGIVGGLLVGALSGSSLTINGPTASLAAVLVAAIASLGSFEALLAAGFVAGLMQLAFAALRLGRVSSLMPSGVVRGMLVSVGLLLVIKQLPHLVGYDVEAIGVDEFVDTAQDMEVGPGETNTFGLLAEMFEYFEAGALLIGIASLGILFSWERAVRHRIAVPGALIAVAFGVAANAVFIARFPALALSDKHLIAVPLIGGVSSLLAALPNLSWQALGNPHVYGVAASIAVIGSLESLLSIDAVDRLDPDGRKSPPNRELFAQGIGNVVVSLCGGLPVVAVLARSTVAVSAGSRSKATNILHGVWLIAVLLWFEHAVNLVPLAALAAVLVHTGMRLVSPKEWATIIKRGPGIAIPFVATIVGTLFGSLLWGIVFGLVAAGFFILRGSYGAPAFTLSDQGMVVHIKLAEQVHFLHRAPLEAALDKIKPNTLVDIDGSRARYIDPDVFDLIDSFVRQARGRHIDVLVGGIDLLRSPEELTKRMDDEYKTLLESNREWVREKTLSDPGFFKRSGEGQAPSFLFIGCSDSRVPIDTITKTDPGAIFTHRNIANICSLSDINLMSVLQYSVEVLAVRHIIVCGHYGCGGVKSALSHQTFGLIDNWIAEIKRVALTHREELDTLSPEDRTRRVTELHVFEQTRNLMRTSLVQNAVKRHGYPRIHGWVYDLHTGLIKDLQVEPEIDPAFRYD